MNDSLVILDASHYFEIKHNNKIINNNMRQKMSIFVVDISSSWVERSLHVES